MGRRVFPCPFRQSAPPGHPESRISYSASKTSLTIRFGGLMRLASKPRHGMPLEEFMEQLLLGLHGDARQAVPRSGGL